MNSAPNIDQPSNLTRFARIVLDCLHRTYPNQIAHVFSSDEDAQPPQALHPAFFGCYDWHSAVHGHWCLVRLIRSCPDEPWIEAARSALAQSLTRENLQAELAYLLAPGREAFERPYGLAWLLQLAAELREWDDPIARTWLEHLVPLEKLGVERLSAWLSKLTHPIRSGEHSQSAFAMGLALDWARCTRNAAFTELLRARASDFHANDIGWSFAFEPSGHDFLSPALAEADLMRRVLPTGEFADWLDRFLPELSFADAQTHLAPLVTPDASDGKLAHLDGLNLSRAWMLEGILTGLPKGDSRTAALHSLAKRHRAEGLAAVTGKHYAGAHWLASFAVYLSTRRGLESP